MQAQLGVCVVTCSLVDEVTYAFLGHEDREPISLLDLIHALKSPVVD